MNTKLILAFGLALGLQACTGRTDRIDAVIARLDTADFSQLKAYTIFFRSRGTQNGTSVYFVEMSNANCSPYAVDVDDDKKAVLKVRNDMVLNSCRKDYLTEEEIKKAIGHFLDYKINLIKVDSSGNVYINPDRPEKALLLRRSANSTPGDIGEFRHYKENWYVRIEN